MMILDSDKKLLEDLYLKRIDYIEFCREKSFSNDFDLLKVCIEQKENELLEYALVYYHYRGFNSTMCRQLQELITNDWHRHHAEIARIFQFKITCVNSIEPILESVKKQHSYLFDQDDFYPYVQKCVNAIRVIGNDKAKKALEALMTTFPDLEVRRLAKNQLTKFEDK